MKKQPKAGRKKTVNRFPKGWNQKRVRALLDHYENQTDEQAAREDDAAYEDPRFTMLAVPIELVPAVKKMIAKKAG
jgi:hypothetical protein